MARDLKIAFPASGAFSLAAGGMIYSNHIIAQTLSTGGGSAQRYNPGWYFAIQGAEKTTAQGKDSGTQNVTFTGPTGNPLVVNVNFANAGIPGGRDGTLGGFSPVQGAGLTGPWVYNSGQTVFLNTTCMQGYSWLELEPGARGVYNFVNTDADIATCMALGTQYLMRVNFRSFNTNIIVPSYVPTFQYTQGASKPNGTEAQRWDTVTYLPAIKALFTAFAQRYSAIPNFAGIATQETSLGTPSSGTIESLGWTYQGYVSNLNAESDAIVAAAPLCRPHHYVNFMPGTVPNGDYFLDQHASHIQQNGAVLGFPDLVSNNPGRVESSVYPRMKPYQRAGSVTRSGTTAPAPVGSATTTFSKKAPTFGCLQPAEWTGPPGLAPAIPQTPQQWYDYATNTNTYGTNPSTNSPLTLDIIMPDFQQNSRSGGPTYAGSSSTTALTPVIIAHPSFNFYTP